MVTIKNELKAMEVMGDGEEGRVRSSYLLRLMQATPTPVHIECYLKIMLNAWLGRQLIQQASRTVAAAYEGQIEPPWLLVLSVEWLQTLAASVRGRDATYFMSHEQSLEHFVRLSDAMVEEESNASQPEKTGRATTATLPHLRFGWPELDGRYWAEPPVLSLLPSTLTTILGRLEEEKR